MFHQSIYGTMDSLSVSFSSDFPFCKYAIGCVTMGIRELQFCAALNMCDSAWILIYRPRVCAQLKLYSCLNKCTLCLCLSDWF